MYIYIYISINHYISIIITWFTREIELVTYLLTSHVLSSRASPYLLRDEQVLSPTPTLFGPIFKQQARVRERNATSLRGKLFFLVCPVPRDRRSKYLPFVGF